MGISLVEASLAGALSIVAIGGGSYSIATFLSPTPVNELGSAIEGWSVTQPGDAIPGTQDYVNYSEFKKDKGDYIPYTLQEELPDMNRAGTTWVKVSTSGPGSSFTVCTHKGDNADPAGNEILSYDSATGEEIANEAEICS